jgi:hypothetical protein
LAHGGQVAVFGTRFGAIGVRNVMRFEHSMLVAQFGEGRPWPLV